MYSRGPEHSKITALLGPTNTGKTHRAVERMLEHDSAMMGLPLRLLAREIYDRVTARIGESRVALVTGEERRVPARPSYWICTVEAMPDVEVDFLAVDEIQIAAHAERGHVFTDRLLHARGRLETWFLGSSAIAGLMAQLVPTAQMSSHPRLSRLRHRGRLSLRALPRRSAIVAFSVEEVYGIAERVRRSRGGAAVVLGALSPRTRNAQVAMYQAGEVDTLVATDAIGMGLNLDLDHVAFASTRKFDGRQSRSLSAAELGQIAGRAGRFTQDGTFGALSPLPALSDRLVERLEHHRFDDVRRVVWRNSDLCFDSLDELIESLRRAPARKLLRRVEHADDFSSLMSLAGRAAVRQRVSSPERVRLLWDVCQVPDYRKLLAESHVGLLEQVFFQLTDRGCLDEEWMRARLAEIDDVTADVDLLTMRLSFIRTWTYVVHRHGWVLHPGSWQQRTRDIEDRLSDALHGALVARFVERTRKHLAVSKGARDSSGNPFQRLAPLLERMEPHRDSAPSPGDWAERAIDAPHDDFELCAEGFVEIDGRRVARLQGTGQLLHPEVSLVDPDLLAPGQRARLARRVVAWGRDLLGDLVEPLRRAGRGADVSAPLRGLLYQLERGLGVVRVRGAGDQLSALDSSDGERLVELGIRVGRRYVYCERLLTPHAMARRAALCHVHFGRSSASLAAGAACAPCDVPAWRAAAGSAEVSCNGAAVCGEHLVRVDVVEAVLLLLEARGGGDDVLERVASACDASEDVASQVAAALGFRRGPDGADPPRSRKRRRPRRRRRRQAGPDTPTRGSDPERQH